jgi:hypothetical protein
VSDSEGLSDSCGCVEVLEMQNVPDEEWTVYFVMPTFSHSLREYLGSMGAVVSSQLVCAKLVACIVSIHGCNIVHGGICPDHILLRGVTASLEVRLCSLRYPRNLAMRLSTMGVR